MKRKMFVAGVISFLSLLGFSLHLKGDDRAAGPGAHVDGAADAFLGSQYAQCGGGMMRGHTQAHEYQGEEKKKGEEHGEHSHMEQMEKVREWLKEELGDKYDGPGPSATTEQIEIGRQLYVKSCITCHGVEGRGDGPAASALPLRPSDFTDPEHSSFYSEQGRLYIIRKGIEGTTMPGWEKTMSEDEIQNVYAYVRSLMSSEKPEQSHEEHGEHRH